MELFNCGSVEYRALVAERDALREQLKEAEQQVIRWRERIERAPKATACVRQDGGLHVFPPPWKSRFTGTRYRVALVRLGEPGSEAEKADK